MRHITRLVLCAHHPTQSIKCIRLRPRPLAPLPPTAAASRPQPPLPAASLLPAPVFTAICCCTPRPITMSGGTISILPNQCVLVPLTKNTRPLLRPPAAGGPRVRLRLRRPSPMPPPRLRPPARSHPHQQRHCCPSVRTAICCCTPRPTIVSGRVLSMRINQEYVTLPLIVLAPHSARLALARVTVFSVPS